MFEVLPLFFFGLAFGSFVNALVWRLRKKRNFVSERSECTHCHHVLAWYDLIPVVSWVLLRGKCRYCKKPIDDSPLTELSVALAFGLSYVFWPLGFSTVGVVLFVLWLIVLAILAALFLYDLKWMLLPNVLVFPLIGIGIVWSVIHQLTAASSFLAGALSVVYALAGTFGIYGSLYAVSKGKWVGFGDVKLTLFMGLVLTWQQGLVAIMLANGIAFLFVLPGLLTGKVKRTARIPFGPFLILATVLALLFGDDIIRWYMSTALALGS